MQISVRLKLATVSVLAFVTRARLSGRSLGSANERRGHHAGMITSIGSNILFDFKAFNYSYIALAVLAIADANADGASSSRYFHPFPSHVFCISLLFLLTSSWVCLLLSSFIADVVVTKENSVQQS